MIISFQDRETEKIFNLKQSRKLPLTIQRVAIRKLVMIDSAITINDLRIPPANHLEKLKGEREGQYSIRINQQWRICFNWNAGNASQVEIIDYH